MIAGKRIGFYANGDFQKFPIEKTCELLADIGYDAVELDRRWLSRKADQLRKEKAVIDRSGLVLSEAIVQLDYVTKDPLVHQQAIAQTLAYMERCADIGIGTINLFTGPCPWLPDAVEVGKNMTLSQAWGMVWDAFDVLVPRAEALGVELAVENVWGMVCHDFFTAKYLIDHYHCKSLGVNFDPSHDALAGNRDMAFLLNGWGREQLKHIHLKDAAGTQCKGNVLFPPLGEGTVDWNGFSLGLAQCDYQGVLSVEFEAEQHLAIALGGDWIAAARDSFFRVGRLLAK